MCWYCGTPVAAPEPLGRSLLCPGCGKELRVCMHCRFHLPGARGDCSEPNADPPAEKDRANFCDWFSLDPRYRSASAGQKKKADASAAARSAFEDLFK